MEADLHSLAEHMPHRYARDEATGGWRCPPGERYAAQYDCYYHVRSSAEINWVLQRNLLFLQDYLRDDYPKMDDAARVEIHQMIEGEPGLKLDVLLRYLQHANLVSQLSHKAAALGRIHPAKEPVSSG
jgi:putative transposase